MATASRAQLKNRVAFAGYELEALEHHLPELETAIASAIDEMNSGGLIRQPLQLFIQVQGALAEVRGGVAAARAALEQVGEEIT